LTKNLAFRRWIAAGADGIRRWKSAQFGERTTPAGTVLSDSFIVAAQRTDELFNGNRTLRKARKIGPSSRS
jgi:hypothetical protein